MINPDHHNFNPGGVVDRYDNRDFRWDELGYGAAPFDWNAGFDIETALEKRTGLIGLTLPVKDQGDSSSCGGQAWATYASVLKAMATGNLEERSAKFIYAQTYVPGGGSAGRDNANVYVKQGVAREVMVPSYDHSVPPSEFFMEQSSDITTDDRTDAGFDRAASYAQTGSDIDVIAQAVRENNGVVIGIVGSNNGTWLSAFPRIPTTADTNMWRHWIYAGKAKMINGQRYIGVLNSWGVMAGERGWQWLSADYFYNGFWVFGGWTHVYAASVVPPVFHHTFTVQMDFGTTSGEVKALQTALMTTGEFPSTVPASGYFGNVTRQAVQKFQIEKGIASSGDPHVTGFGRVGPKTLTALNKIFSNDL